MDFGEFIKRIRDCKSSLEHANENNVYQYLSELTDLINSAKNEKYFQFEWERFFALVGVPHQQVKGPIENIVYLSSEELQISNTDI